MFFSLENSISYGLFTVVQSICKFVKSATKNPRFQYNPKNTASKSSKTRLCKTKCKTMCLYITLKPS